MHSIHFLPVSTVTYCGRPIPIGLGHCYYGNAIIFFICQSWTLSLTSAQYSSHIVFLLELLKLRVFITYRPFRTTNSAVSPKNFKKVGQ